MITLSNIRYYIKWLFVNVFWTKFILWPCLVVLADFAGVDNMLHVQYIFVGWMLTMVIGTIAGSMTEWFSWKKFWLWALRMFGYIVMLFLGHAFDKWFETKFAFDFIYAIIALDLIHSFLKHSPVLGITFSVKILRFFETIENRVGGIFLAKWGFDQIVDDIIPTDTKKKK